MEEQLKELNEQNFKNAEQLSASKSQTAEVTKRTRSLSLQVQARENAIASITSAEEENKKRTKQLSNDNTNLQQSLTAAQDQIQELKENLRKQEQVAATTATDIQRYQQNIIDVQCIFS